MNNNITEQISDKNIENLCNKDIKKSLNSIKITLPFLSKYEKTKILGLRIQQLVSGANSTLTKDELEGLKSNIEVAEKELKLKKIPLIISRNLPNNKKELWNIRDLIDLNQ